MTAKKWTICFVGTVLIIAALFGVFNVLTDPFGVFGDPIFDWYSYNETNNPRVAKTAWLKEHFDDFDSYLVGCSSTSSFCVEDFNELYDAKFYNAFTYGADMLDVEQTVRWLIANDEVKHIVLNVYIDYGKGYDTEPDAYTESMHADVDGSSKILFYLKYLFANPQYGLAKIRALKEDTILQQAFDVFDVETGCYDKSKRDIENIGDMDAYLETYPVFQYYYPTEPSALEYIDDCMRSLANIRQMCDEAGTELTVVSAPIYWEYLNTFSREEVEYFFTSMANVTDYYDFSYSSVSFEPRYFYDNTHFRNCVGEMAADYIAGGSENYLPDDFGEYVTSENVRDRLDLYWDARAAEADDITADVPVLLYHHLANDGETVNDMTVTASKFEEDIRTLSEAGYNAVNFEQLQNFVEYGNELPEKPIVITFDDGYLSNYEIAYPILEKYGMCATIFAIGYSFGCDTYKDTDTPIIAHFNAEKAREMVESGVIDVQSHSFGMHESSSLEEDEARECIAPLTGETERDFYDAVQEDFAKSKELLEPITGKEVNVLAYPHGTFDDLTQVAVVAAGAEITLGTVEKSNVLVKGLSQCLLGMHRFSVLESTTEEQLMNKVISARN